MVEAPFEFRGLFSNPAREFDSLALDRQIVAEKIDTPTKRGRELRFPPR
jgi:hypothetical protein